MTRKTYHSEQQPTSALIDERAERDLLGYMILAWNSPSIRQCTPELFATQTHRDIAASILHLVENGIAVDYLEVSQELCRCGKSADLAYISDLTRGVVIARTAERRIAYLQELSHRRKLAKLAETLAVRACNLADPLPAVIAEVLECVPIV